MRKAVYYRLVAIAVIAVVVCSLISSMIFAVYSQNQAEYWLSKLTYSVESAYEDHHSADSLSVMAGGSRVTVIAPDGVVLSDSEADADKMENHLNREEIQNASQDKVYIAIHNSTTLGQQYMYAAIVADDGNIVRVAYVYSGLISNVVVQLSAVFLAIAVALVVSLFFAGRFSGNVFKPLEQVVQSLSIGKYDELPQIKSNYYEVDRLVESIQNLSEKIAKSKTKILAERDKVDYILSEMAEGFVFLDQDKNILLCNSSAKAFFSISPELDLLNLSYLTPNFEIQESVDLALLQKQSSIFDLMLREDLSVEVYVSPIISRELGDNQVGATILFVDKSAQKQLEQQKQDFFSNVSHELKTPITSIAGFAEMLSLGMFKTDAEKLDVVKRIETESKRMSELINHILVISKLESSETSGEVATFDFENTVLDAVRSVSLLQDQMGVEIELNLTPVIVSADKTKLYELSANLIENAVKYNKPGGSVNVALRLENDNAILTVTDTGIGIPLEFQPRIFERFFRVDYGRDKKIGGTGLGLSIVKHIVASYKGEITLHSQQDSGTTITVSLPIVA